MPTVTKVLKLSTKIPQIIPKDIKLNIYYTKGKRLQYWDL